MEAIEERRDSVERDEVLRPAFGCGISGLKENAFTVCILTSHSPCVNSTELTVCGESA